MPNIFKNFLNSMKLTEDDGFDDYLDDDEFNEPKKSRRLDKKPEVDDFDETPKRQQ